MDPFQPWRSAFALWRVTAEAQAVIALRLMGLWGVLPSSPRERHVMVAEKGPAFAKAAWAAGQAAARGAGPDAVIEAAIKPLRRRTSANLKRLTRPKGKG